MILDTHVDYYLYKYTILTITFIINCTSNSHTYINKFIITTINDYLNAADAKSKVSESDPISAIFNLASSTAESAVGSLAVKTLTELDDTCEKKMHDLADFTQELVLQIYIHTSIYTIGFIITIHPDHIFIYIRITNR